MAGHGSPRASRCFWPRAATAGRWGWCALLLLSLTSIGLGADNLRLRIAWGGGSPRLWRGTIEVSEGTLSEPHALGIEADEPGSMWLETDARLARQRLVVEQRSPRAYDGVDLLVAAPDKARLLVRLKAADDAKPSAAIEISLADLIAGLTNKDLDSYGNRLLVTRSPGDRLRVSFSRTNLIFTTGERFRFSVQPHALPSCERGRTTIKAQLIGGNKEWWSNQRDLPADADGEIPFEIPLPGEEGVYDLALTAVNNLNWSQAVRQPLSRRKVLAERHVQLLLLSPQRPPATQPEGEFTQVVEIDPANPRWYEKLPKLPQLPALSLPKARLASLLHLGKGSLGNGGLLPCRHVLGDLVQLRPNAESSDVSWEAYSLPISQPGHPHMLEVDYPSDRPQTLGVSILEPNAGGGLTSISPDSGVDVAPELVPADGSPRWRRHRLLFWPRTNAPMVLMSNGCNHSPAVYGKIRLLAGRERLSRLLPNRPGPGQRLLMGYFDRPIFPEDFSAEEGLDFSSGRSLDDWGTFYQGGTRLVEYMNHAGYNGLMLAVLADGSTIYPSSLLEPTPRYDTGAFFASAQDPVRKDVVEMLLRLFDREDLQLIPLVEFSAPLPELEALRRAGGSDAQAIQWIGSDGDSWQDTWPAQRGLAPYYNVLHPRVQEAMLRVLRELMRRCGPHPSFAGLAIQLSADGYAQLPGPDWGMDDLTISQFERDAQIHVPGADAQRFADRAAFLTQGPYRQLWLQWRAARLSTFYRRVAEELTAVRPNSRLYLAGVGMLNGPDLQAVLRPTLSRRTSFAEALLRVGIDLHEYESQPQIVFLRPQRVVPHEDLGARAVDLEVDQMPDIDRCFQKLPATGSLFFHPPQEIHIESFDRKSPFKPSYTCLILQPTPSGQQDRRRFVHSLATLDPQVLVDGGWFLSLGQEDALRNVVAAYRNLPAVRFQPADHPADPEVSRPVTFRSGTAAGRTYLYAVNDAPFAATARIHVQTSPVCQVTELTGNRTIEPLRADGGTGMYWEVHLDPYDLVAVQFSEPNVQFSDPHVTWPAGIESMLSDEIRRLGARAASLSPPPAVDVLANADFELPAAADGQIPDWTTSHRSGTIVQLDTREKHSGNQSVHMSSNGPVTCLVSRPFSMPNTGRLTMSVWLRVADARHQPPLRLALEAKLQGRDYYRFAPVGSLAASDPQSKSILPEWGRYIVPIGDLPLEGLSSLRIRFDLMEGGGEVWIDDVQIYSLAFTRSEERELCKLVYTADALLQKGRIGDCLHQLDGYWLQFLEANVPLPPNMPTDPVATEPRPTRGKPPERSGFLNRLKNLVPESLRF